MEQLYVIRMLCAQQTEMFRNNTHQVPDRIVSLHKPWVGSIVRGKQNADVEFGAKVKMSVVNGFLRVEDLFWDALNDGNTLQASVESFRPAYGYDPKRILTDTFSAYARICATARNTIFISMGRVLVSRRRTQRHSGSRENRSGWNPGNVAKLNWTLA